MAGVILSRRARRTLVRTPDSHRLPQSLFDPKTAGALRLSNRIVMAPLAWPSKRASLTSYPLAEPIYPVPAVVTRLRDDGPTAPLTDRETFHGGGAHGYIDYPVANQALLQVAAVVRAPRPQPARHNACHPASVIGLIL